MPRSRPADLRRRSIEVILDGQAPSGAYVACPTFPPYQYCWLRDGSFIADAMSRAGERASAEAFFDFVERLDGFDARYRLDGRPDDSEDWPLRQHDGWGLFLWSVREHCRRHGVTPRWETGRIVRRLERVRYDPCVDWWEEREGVHAATLACIAAGLEDDLDLSRAEDRLDASLLALPLLGYELTRPVHDLLSPGGGVWRHLEDEYYGGGEWLLLTAMWGLCFETEAADCLAWIEAHATPEGNLPEQVQDHLLRPEGYEYWAEKWGPPPSPLLWSHAMYLDLANVLHH
jgi:GH15 family glucan-1,4-alpha-glucosidase